MLKSRLCALRENRNDDRGFSLVELIIVIAIMVALVAMMAPQFVKYVQKAHDAVVSQASQDVLSMAKTEFALGKFNFVDSNDRSAKIVIKADENTHVLAIELENLTYDGKSGDDANEAFAAECGIDTTKTSKSNLVYNILIDGNSFSSPAQVTISEEHFYEEDGTTSHEAP